MDDKQIGSDVTKDSYWAKAKKFAAMEPEENRWFALEVGKKHTDEWAHYFENHLGWMPWGMEQLKYQRIKVFMTPTEFPWMFDFGYLQPKYAAPHWPPYENREKPSAESIARVMAMAKEVREHGQMMAAKFPKKLPYPWKQLFGG